MNNLEQRWTPKTVDEAQETSYGHTDAAKLMQISRTTLYRIIELNSIPLKRFTDRTVRISR